ncbi:MAG: hypothetical protein RTU30_07435 [Candidatus Thorarchaeota archaeon]
MMTTNTEETHLVLSKDSMPNSDLSTSTLIGTSLAVYAPPLQFVYIMELYCNRYTEGWLR